MKLLQLLVFMLAAAVFTSAQSGATLTGTVLYNGRPVERAIVTATPIGVRGTAYSAVTDASGSFAFDLIKPGEYAVTAAVTSAGVLRSGQAPGPVVITRGRTERLVLAIDDSSSVIEQVTVSADHPQHIEHVSKTVDVITGQEMRYRADFALIESLRTIPGLRVQQLGGFGRTATIKTRGLRNQDTAILIDGIRFRDASSITGDASAFLSDLTLTSVSKVEVLRGSGSSLYGTNAVGGTVDLQTARPAGGFHGQLSVATGGLGLRRFRGNVSDGMKSGKLGYTLAVSRTAYTAGIDGNDNAHNTNFQSRIDYSPTVRTALSGRFFISDAFVRLNLGPDTLGTPPATNLGIINARPGTNFVFDLDDPDSTQKSKFFNGQFTITQVVNSQLFLEGTYSGLRTARKNENGPLGSPFQTESSSFFDGTIQTAGAKLMWTPLPENQVTAGYEFEQEKFGNDGRTPSGSANFFTRAFQSSHTFFVHNLLQLFDRRLQVAGGLRAQMFGLQMPAFSLTNAPYSDLRLGDPPAAYTLDGSISYYFASTATKIRAHTGNGYRVPSLYERFGTFFSTFGTPAFVALGDPYLTPEKTVAFDAGVEQDMFKDRVRLTATYFYTHLRKTIGFGNVVPNIGTTVRPFGGYIDTQGGIARGAEFSAKLRPTNSFDLFASYTHTNSDQAVPQISGSGVLQTMGIPDHQFTLVATQRVGNFWANFDLVASSGYLSPIFSGTTFNSYVYRFGGNRRADLTAGYTFPIRKERSSLRLHATLENLFDHEYYENGFRTVGRNGRIGLAFVF